MWVLTRLNRTLSGVVVCSFILLLSRDLQVGIVCRNGPIL